MASRNELSTALTQVLSPLGYRRRSGNWYRTRDEIYTVVNIQTSRFADTLYLNIGVHFADLMETDWLVVHRCHLNFRAEALSSVSATDIGILDDTEAPRRVSGEERVAILAELFALPIARAIDGLRKKEDLITFLQTGVSRRVFIHSSMKDWLRSRSGLADGAPTSDE